MIPKNVNVFFRQRIIRDHNASDDQDDTNKLSNLTIYDEPEKQADTKLLFDLRIGVVSDYESHKNEKEYNLEKECRYFIDNFIKSFEEKGSTYLIQSELLLSDKFFKKSLKKLEKNCKNLKLKSSSRITKDKPRNGPFCINHTPIKNLVQKIISILINSDFKKTFFKNNYIWNAFLKSLRKLLKMKPGQYSIMQIIDVNGFKYMHEDQALQDQRPSKERPSWMSNINLFYCFFTHLLTAIIKFIKRNYNVIGTVSNNYHVYYEKRIWNKIFKLCISDENFQRNYRRVENPKGEMPKRDMYLHSKKASFLTSFCPTGKFTKVNPKSENHTKIRIISQLKEKSTFQNLMFDTMSFMSFMYPKKFGSNRQVWCVNLAISKEQGFLKMISR